MSALNPDGTLNVEHLTEEIRTELFLDSKYRAEDEMKKRVVHTSKNYDEFQAFVSCSQLKPVQTKELQAAFQPPGVVGATGNRRREGMNISNGPFVASSSTPGLTWTDSVKTKKNLHMTKKMNENVEKVHTKGPEQMTVSSFERSWRRECPTTKDKMHFLTHNITPMIFSSQSMYGKCALDPAVMSEIIHVLSVGLKEEQLEAIPAINKDDSKESTMNTENGEDAHSDAHSINNILLNPRVVFDWLRSLTNCDRFGLNVSFLSKSTKEELSFLLDHITEASNDTIAKDETIISAADVKLLIAQYKI